MQFIQMKESLLLFLGFTLLFSIICLILSCQILLNDGNEGFLLANINLLCARTTCSSFHFPSKFLLLYVDTSKKQQYSYL